ncbi:hypothetical protein [Oceaniglobus roseus]|uniref:hypothetical protein n=1 Tax=Oceaniglobus roseus TaxID=1737570 RepID=UPI000C7EE479|nr:hypothetical protein [Kandeliimicrobium roseum]
MIVAYLFFAMIAGIVGFGVSLASGFGWLASFGLGYLAAMLGFAAVVALLTLARRAPSTSSRFARSGSGVTG